MLEWWARRRVTDPPQDMGVPEDTNARKGERVKYIKPVLGNARAVWLLGTGAFALDVIKQ